jgi:hypothetical protein
VTSKAYASTTPSAAEDRRCLNETDERFNELALFFLSEGLGRLLTSTWMELQAIMKTLALG